MVLSKRTRDSKKFVVLARAVGKAVDRLAGTEKVPIVDPFWHENKKQCVADLAHLFISKVFLNRIGFSCEVRDFILMLRDVVRRA
jgi:hypothetical protein